MTSYPKSDSVNRCAFTQEIFLLNFIPIKFETTEPWAFWKRSPQQEAQAYMIHVSISHKQRLGHGLGQIKVVR